MVSVQWKAEASPYLLADILDNTREESEAPTLRGNSDPRVLGTRY
jgi:hypothetical protein